MHKSELWSYEKTRVYALPRIPNTRLIIIRHSHDAWIMDTESFVQHGLLTKKKTNAAIAVDVPLLIILILFNWMMTKKTNHKRPRKKEMNRR